MFRKTLNKLSKWWERRKEEMELMKTQPHLFSITRMHTMKQLAEFYENVDEYKEKEMELTSEHIIRMTSEELRILEKCLEFVLFGRGKLSVDDIDVLNQLYDEIGEINT